MHLTAYHVEGDPLIPRTEPIGEIVWSTAGAS